MKYDMYEHRKALLTVESYMQDPEEIVHTEEQIAEVRRCLELLGLWGRPPLTLVRGIS